VLVRLVTTLQLKCCGHKGYNIFDVHISIRSKYIEYGIRDHPIIKQFLNVFPKDIPIFPPNMEVNFFIELMLGTTPVSKSPYKMRTVKLIEMKFHLKEMLDKGHIMSSISSWGEPMLFARKEYGTLRLSWLLKAQQAHQQEKISISMDR